LIAVCTARIQSKATFAGFGGLLLRSVADVLVRPVERFPLKDDIVRERAFELAWTLLRPELHDFSAAEIRSIRSFLARAVLEAGEEGETHCGHLGVTALRKLCANLRGDCWSRFEAVS
jgi:hypothetical protein